MKKVKLNWKAIGKVVAWPFVQLWRLFIGLLKLLWSLFVMACKSKSTAKIKFDIITEPFLLLPLAIMTYFAIWSLLLEIFSGMNPVLSIPIISLTCIAFIAIIYFGIKKFISFYKKRKDRYKKKLGENKQATIWSWLKTTSIILLLWFMWLPCKDGVISISEDFKRVAVAIPRENPKSVYEMADESRISTLLTSGKPRTVNTGSLEGHNMGNKTEDFTPLNVIHTGQEGIVPLGNVEVNFRENLLFAWKLKMKSYPGWLSIRWLYLRRALGYNAFMATRMTIYEYIFEAQKSVDIINDHIHWEKAKGVKNVQELIGLENDQLKFLKEVSESITGKDLIAYVMTELMPSLTEGDKNMAVLDFSLRGGGRDFVELFPALGDKMASCGSYQFTSWAIYDVLGKRRGASLINQAVDKAYRIPGSVGKLRGNDHHKAAYLFAIANLGQLIKLSDERSLPALKKNWKANKLAMVSFIATAHNNPSEARTAMWFWLANDCKDEYVISCSNDIKNYAIKTRANWNELNKNK